MCNFKKYFTWIVASNMLVICLDTCNLYLLFCLATHVLIMSALKLVFTKKYCVFLYHIVHILLKYFTWISPQSHVITRVIFALLFVW